MPKKIITMSEEMARVIDREASRRGAPAAFIIREAIAEWAAKRGIEISPALEWGGVREHNPEQEDQGQLVPAPVG